MRGTFWSNGQVIMSAVAGIDIALWDLKGKALGVPVYELLGGPTRDRVRVYVHLRGTTAEELVEDALARTRGGVHGAALRDARRVAHRLEPAGRDRGDGARAPRRCARRSATRSTCCSTRTRCSRPTEAAYLGHALEPTRLFFYEDPIRPLNPTSLKLVRDKVNLPIATGEQLAHKWEFQPLIEGELLDYLRIDMVHAGGITEAKKILAMAEAHGQRSALHHMSAPVNAAACLHVDAAIPNFGIQEWAELEPLYDLFPNAPRAEAGYVALPTGPGLGLEFDEAEARKRPSRDARLPQRYRADGSHADY